MQSQKLTLSEMAARMHRSTKTFAKYVHKLSIPHIKLGKEFLFDAEEVEKFLAAHTEANRQQTVTVVVPNLAQRRITGSNRGRFAGRLGI